MATLVKTDRNGTKYFIGQIPCERCGGAGGADKWAFTGWTCYKCGGTGKQEGSWKEYTKEYEAKLIARREAKAKQREEEEAKEQAELEAKIKAEKEAKEAELKAQEEAEAQRKAISQYVGNEGDKIEQTLIFDHTAWWEQKSYAGYGTEVIYLHCFRDTDGNLFTWKTQKSLSWLVNPDKDEWASYEEGDKVTVKGTIKEHTEYKGEKQTVLTRCKIIR